LYDCFLFSAPQLKRDPLGGSTVARPALDYLILDAVADDVESLVQIRERVADSAPSESHLVATLRRLVHERLVEAYSIPGAKAELISAGEGIWPPAPAEDLWFQITGRGKMVHETWASGAEGAA
jgi:hypothetical protein